MRQSLFVAVVALFALVLCASARAEPQAGDSAATSAFQMRDLAAHGDAHETFPRDNSFTRGPESTELRRRVLLDASSLESASAVACKGPALGFFDIEVSFTRAGSQAFDAVHAYLVGRGAWAYLVCGRVVETFETTYHREATPYPRRWMLRAALPESDARECAAIINEEIRRREKPN